MKLLSISISVKTACFQLCLIVLSSLLLLMYAPNATYAWEYKEHAKLSFEAYTLACQHIKSKSNEDIHNHRNWDKLNALCTKERRYCYSHRVAVAADYVLTPERLIKNIGETSFLHNTDSDCRDLNKIKLASGLDGYINAADLVIDNFDKNKNVLDSISETFNVSQIQAYHDLFDIRTTSLDSIFDKELNSYWPFIRNIQLGLLATENQTHFHPYALEEWRKNLIKVKYSDPLDKAFSYHAFSMHFLQDAFSAGHYGIKRDKYEQAYGNAYHDRMSSTGYFVKSEEDSWHSYGDDNLYTPSTYVLFDKNYNKSPKDFILQVESALNIKLYKDLYEKNYGPIETAINRYKKSSESDFVLAIPFKKGNVLCFWFDVCDTQELLLIHDESVAYNPNHHCLEKLNSDGLRITTCNETHRYALDQSVRNMRLFLDCMTLNSGPCNERTQFTLFKKETEDNFPIYYKRLAYNNESSLNGLPSFLEYADYIKTDYNKNGNNIPQYNMGAFGYALTCDSSNCDDRNRFSFSYNLEQHLALKWGVYEHNSDAKRFSNELSLIDYLKPFKRFEYTRNVLGLSFLMQGTVSDRRNDFNEVNLQCGAGVRLDMHIAKFIIYAEATRLSKDCHYSLEFNRVDSDDEDRFTIGIEVASIRLRNSDLQFE